MKKFFAEFFSTFLLIFGGTGLSVLNDVYSLHLSTLLFAVFWGALIVVLIFLFADISGAHMNPTVTLALVFDGKISVRQAAFYILAQFSGSMLASAVLKILFPHHTSYGATLPLTNLFAVCVTELLLTFALIVVVYLTYGKKFRTLAVSFFSIIAIDILIGSGISGASMNPARSLGPAVVSHSMRYYWVYLIMPVAGTAFAYLFMRLIRKTVPLPMNKRPT